jgi:hypothetical protein
MNTSVSPTLISRITLVIVILASVAAAFWAGAKFLEPVTVPPPPPSKGYVKFNVKTDVSKNPVFAGLEALGPKKIESGELGRQNPFVPVPKPVETSTTTTSTNGI